MEISSAKVRHWEFQSRRKQQVRAIGPQITENKRIMKKLFMLSIAAMALATLSAHAGDAKSIYADNCTKCHGADGKGDTKMGQRLGVKDYSTAAVQDRVEGRRRVQIHQGRPEGQRRQNPDESRRRHRRRGHQGARRLYADIQEVTGPHIQRRVKPG